jgi:hypothetical protein
VEIRYIQVWLGYESIKTTEKYTHVAMALQQFKNPIDDCSKNVQVHFFVHIGKLSLPFIKDIYVCLHIQKPCMQGKETESHRNNKLEFDKAD